MTNKIDCKLWIYTLYDLGSSILNMIFCTLIGKKVFPFKQHGTGDGWFIIIYQAKVSQKIKWLGCQIWRRDFRFVNRWNCQKLVKLIHALILIATLLLGNHSHCLKVPFTVKENLCTLAKLLAISSRTEKNVTVFYPFNLLYVGINAWLPFNTSTTHNYFYEKPKR